MHLRRVILETPYAAPTPDGIARNLRYARAALRDCILKGDAPIASHLLLTQPGVLDDQNPTERAMGIEAGLTWGPGRRGHRLLHRPRRVAWDASGDRSRPRREAPRGAA